MTHARRFVRAALLVGALGTAGLVHASPAIGVRAAWVQYGPDGAVEARAVVSGSAAACPRVRIDGAERAMQLRAPANDLFPAICGVRIPPGTSALGLAGRALPLPAADPRRIVVIGDTGCRIKASKVQDCLDPRRWPFPRLAAEEAKVKPDLVIDVGDYLYRESACPAADAACAGSAHGDNWPTWNADFFAPAAPLLAAAPWVLVRGNHEQCARAGMGWLRLLGPLPVGAAGTCARNLAPYTVTIGGLHLIVMDDANAPDVLLASSLVPTYRREFATLAQAPARSWLLMHRPIWGAIAGPLDIPIGGNRTLIAAIGRAGVPPPVQLMLAGHIHSFEALNYGGAQRVPPQIIAGFGGDLLDHTPLVLGGAIFQGDSGVTVTRGVSIPGFGFVVLRRAARGWDVEVHDVSGRLESRCWFRGGRLGCAPRRLDDLMRAHHGSGAG